MRFIQSVKFQTRLFAVLLVLAFAALYVFTAQHGVSWGDSGGFQHRILANDLTGSSGLALAHPLYVATAHFLSCLVPAACRIWFINATCGVWGALAVGMMFLCAIRLSRSFKAAVLAALSLGFAHMFWWSSTMSEVYTLSAFLLGCETYALLVAVQDRRTWIMIAAFFANGLHFSDHNFALLSLPIECGVAIWLVWTVSAPGRRMRNALLLAAASALVWCIGAMPMLALAAMRYGQLGSPSATLMDVLVGSYGAAVSGNMGVPFRITLFNYALAALSFALPCFFLSAKSFRFVKLKSAKAESILVATLFLCHFLFWIRYRVADQATFLLPTLFMSVLLASTSLTSVRRPFLAGILTIALAIGVPHLAVWGLSASSDQLLKQRGQLPFRDDLRYFAFPWKHNEDSAARFIAAAARELPHGSFVYVDQTTGSPLACARHLGLIPADIQLSLDDHSSAPPSSRWEIRPVVRYRLSPPEATLVKRGTFYEVILP